MPPLKPGLVSFFISFLLCTQARSESTGYLFISNETTNNIAVVDPGQSYRIIKWVPTSHRPTDMHLRNHARQLLVACGTDNVIDVVDVRTLEVVDHIPTGPGPRMFQISRDGNTLYLLNGDTSTVQEINIAEKIIVREFATGADPQGVILDGNERTLYVTSDIDDLVHVIDLDVGAATANIKVGTHPGHLNLSPNSNELWVANELSGQISIIDRRTDKAIGAIEFLTPGIAAPQGMTMTANGETAIIALGPANHVGFVNTVSHKIEGYVSAGRWAHAVALSQDEKTLFVTNRQSDDLSIVDVEGRRLIGSIAVGGNPYAVVVDK